MRKMHQLKEVDCKEWTEYFNDWNKMSLKDQDEIVKDRDFVIVNQVCWQKLHNHFGGAPEIMFQIIDPSTQSNSALQ